MKNQKILVLGGSGFIGTNLLNELIKNYKYLYATYNKSKKFKKFKKVNYSKIDLHNLNECEKVTKKKDIVIMCAANSSGAGIMKKDPLTHLDSNMIMNLNILKSCYKNKVKKFIFISSNTVYPESNKPMLEQDVNYKIYKSYFVVGWMKLFSEKVCEMYSKNIKKKMTTIIIRPGNLYGPYDKFDKLKSKVIPSLIRKFSSNNKIVEVWGDGKDIKDFLYIKDFCEILVKIIKKNNKHDTFNIASGKSISINKILNELIKINKKEIKYLKNMPKMIPHRKISIKKIKKEFNFRPKTDLKNGLIKTYKWYFSNRKLNN